MFILSGYFVADFSSILKSSLSIFNQKVLLLSFKVHALNEEKFRPYKKIDQLELIEQESEDALDQVYDDAESSTSLTFQVSFVFRPLKLHFLNL